MKKFKLHLFTLVALLLCLSQGLSAATNFWTGASNPYWHNAANWSLGHIPYANEDVVITSAGFSPRVDNYHELCKSLTINSGVTLRIYDYALTTTGDVTINGILDMVHTSAKLYVGEDITWGSGSSASMTASATIYAYRNWIFSSGANVQLNSGYVDFQGTSAAYIRTYDSDCYFNHIRNNKDGTFIYHSSYSTAPLDINGNLYCYSGSELRSSSSQSITLNGFVNNMGGSLHFDNGTFVFDGASTTSHFVSGDYFSNLTINSTGTIFFDDDIQVNGNVTISGGSFSPGSNTLSLKGNWINTAGTAAFLQVGSRVKFNGSGHQYCNYDEGFYILEVDKSAAALRVNSTGTTVYCSYYDWTDGAVDILEGTFTANDLLDNAIRGSWYLNWGGEINLTNTGGLVDLEGDLHIYGGTMNVYGGTDDSYWPGDYDASVEISGGFLIFHEVGINIRPVNTLIENITGGRVTTVGNLKINRTDFIPASDVFTMAGTTDTYVRIDNGWVSQLDIDKSTLDKTTPVIKNTPAKSSNDQKKDTEPIAIYPQNYKNINSGQKGIYIDGFTGRDGEQYIPTKSNAVTAYDNINIMHMVIYNGSTFDPDGNFVHLTGEMNIMNSGNLKMTNSNDHLYLRHIKWFPSSNENITNGLIEVTGDWTFMDGSNCQIGSGNTVSFLGSGPDLILNDDADGSVEFGSIEINDDIFLSGACLQPLNVTGDFTVTSGNTYSTQLRSMMVDGTFDIEDGATCIVYSMTSAGYLEINSDVVLDGYLEVGYGDVLINGDFELAPTGQLDITDGSFIMVDNSFSWARFYGEFNLTGSGFFETYGNITIKTGSDFNMSDGTIKAHSFFDATETDVFQPTGGKVEYLTGTGGIDAIECSNGNYFYDLVINRTSGSIVLQTDIEIKNDLIISLGRLVAGYSSNWYNITIGGNWTNNVGPTGFDPGEATVIFNGNTYSDITTDETFYHLMINKTNGSYDIVEILENRTVNVLNDCMIFGGCLELNNNTTLDIDDCIVIQSGAGLNAYQDENLNIYVGNDWTNHNTGYSTTIGFNPGHSSTVTFDGSLEQHLYTSAPQEDFCHLVIDKPSGVKLRNDDNIQVLGNCSIPGGEWTNLSANLTNTFWGDLTVDYPGDYGFENYSNLTTMFKGTADQVIDHNGGSISLYHLVIDKSISKSADFSTGKPGEEPGTITQKDSSGTKNQTVTFQGYSSGTDGLWAVRDVVIEEGTLDISGSYWYLYTGNLTINDGGKLTANFGTEVKIYSDHYLTVNNGGTLEMIGTTGSKSMFKGVNSTSTGHATVLVENGGTINTENTIFEHLSDTGIWVKNGGIVDLTNSFTNCEFSAFEPGGQLLRIDNNQTFTIDNAYFPPNTWGGNYNVSKTLNQGEVTLTNATGDFAGPLYENDPYDKIIWDGYVPGIWTGAVNHYWSNPGNWEHNLKPGSSDDVVIPAGTPYDPHVTGSIEECNNITVENGASLSVYDVLTVNKNININGQLRMTDPGAILNVGNNIWWNPGSSASVTEGNINLCQFMFIESGANLQIGTGNTINLSGSCYSSSIRCYESSAYLGNLTVNKSSGYASIYAWSTAPLHISGDMTVMAGNVFRTQG